MSHLLQDEISLSSFRKDFEKYSWKSLRADAFAGLSVAMLTLPQAIAYALVAGLPISSGLFAAIFSSIIVTLFGSSRHLIVGPGNAIAILIQAATSEILFTYYREAPIESRPLIVLQILTQLSFLVGLIQISAAFFKLGRLTHFVSQSVILGYISGVALALVINQLYVLLGLSLPLNATSLYERILYLITHLNSVHLPTAVLGLFCLTFLLIMRKIDRKLPAGTLLLAFIALVAYMIERFLIGNFAFFDSPLFLDLVRDISLVGDTKEGGLIPNWDWPFFNPSIMNNLISVAFAVAVLSVMEALLASKSIAANTGQRLSTNQEIFGLGLGNLFSAFVGAMPVSGSAARSMVNYDSGAKTRLGAFFNSFFVLLILFAFGFLIRLLPISAFAALLIVAAGHIVNFKQLLLCMKATRSDAFVLVVTILACLFFSLDIAFYIGVVMSISLYLKKAAIPQLVEFTIDEEGVLHSLDPTHQHQPRKIRFIKVEGELFFGAADLFQSALKSIAEDDNTTHVIILQLKNARDIDATSCLALNQLYDYIKSSGRHLIACGITHQIWDVLSDSGMIEVIGKNNLFIFDERHPQLSVQRAYTRAHELLNLSLDSKNLESIQEEKILLNTKNEGFTEVISET